MEEGSELGDSGASSRLGETFNKDVGHHVENWCLLLWQH